MNYAAYDTEQYQKIYLDTSNAWMDIVGMEGGFAKIIEKNVRDICLEVANTQLGLTRWSCEGHPEQVRKSLGNSMDAKGYIMIVPKDRASAMDLEDIWNRVFCDIVDIYGWNATPDIEISPACWERDGVEWYYPCLVIRTPYFRNRVQRNMWWKTVTKSFIKNAKEFQK